jgi:GNAT superfamily N-acetyltransferase
LTVSDVRFETNPTLTADELVSLYRSVGWSAYTEDPATLAAAIAGSSFVVVARRGVRLVGLARAVSDDASICYLQDVVVAPFERRRGIGRQLVATVLDRYHHVKQKVLLTDDEPGQRLFYESLGYTEIRDVEGAALRAFVRFDR